MASGSDIPDIAQMREEKDVEGLIEALRHDNGITIDRNISLSSDLFADVHKQEYGMPPGWA